MKIKTIVLTTIVWAMLIQPATGGEVYDYITFFGYTEESITVAWDPVTDAEQYEVKAYHIEQAVDVAIGSTTHPTTQLSLVLPRSGHYKMMVRACEANLCSDWAESTNEEFATYNGSARAWWIYRYISPAGPIVIE